MEAVILTSIVVIVHDGQFSANAPRGMKIAKRNKAKKRAFQNSVFYKLDDYPVL